MEQLAAVHMAASAGVMFAILLQIAVAVSPQSPAVLPSVATASPHFVEAQGRVRIFHGANRVMKRPPWYFPQQLDDEDSEIERMASLGFSVLRLGWMWSGFNPAPNVFNHTYANVMKSIVAKLNAKGIYVLLDMHEDVLSSKFCLYDGAPLWVVNKSVSAHAYPWPIAGNGSNCDSWSWELNELTEAAATAYQDLYDNKLGVNADGTRSGMLDDLAAFWRESAIVWKGVSGVFFEIINEPFAGNFYRDPLILLPGNAGSKNLQRMYDAVAAEIRTVDVDRVIFYEPVTWGMIFEGKILGSGFSHVPGGSEWANASALSWHYYCDTFMPNYNKQTPAQINLTRLVCDDVMKTLIFEAIALDIKTLGGAAMMSEGLACSDASVGTERECDAVMDGLDRRLFSWTDYGVSAGRWSPSFSLSLSLSLSLSFRLILTPFPPSHRCRRAIRGRRVCDRARSGRAPTPLP